MKTLKLRSILALLAASALAVGCGANTDAASSQPQSIASVEQHGADGAHAGRGGRFLQRLDANHDGVLQVAELPERMQSRFEGADANNDGVLTREEMQAFGQARRAARFAELDANHDGALTQDEAGERWARLGRADADGDGRVTSEEFSQMRPGRGHHGPFMGGRMGRGEHRGPGFGHHAPDPSRFISRFDANGDGALQVAELPERMRARVAEADENRDGALSAQELTAAMQRRHAERAPAEAPAAPQPE